ncbi:glutathione S-transferase T2-like [Lotus japonicus]|uniref:glutathione S-transferase T2-like n=1 Tax=Lotus japonicus TaxID=34305 RepID=UPI0025862E0E|nr:glutathione S-transferase T2-like [Lotus japonicus]
MVPKIQLILCIHHHHHQTPIALKLVAVVKKYLKHNLKVWLMSLMRLLSLLKEMARNPKKQRLKWCENDDIILLQTWLNISKDSVTGTDQKAETFWRRIEHQYNKYRKVGSPERQWSQLKSRFHTLSKAVSTFVGCYKKVTNPPKSGYSERDIMADACSLYNAMEKTKTFNFEHAWRVLKDEPKWKGEAMPIYSQQSQHSTDGVHTSIDGSEHEVVQIFSRPPGQKDMKAKAKATTTSNNEQKMAEAESLVKEKEERMARLERLKKNDQLKMLNDILLQDTSNMNEEQLADFKNICVYTRRQLEDLFKE